MSIAKYYENLKHRGYSGPESRDLITMECLKLDANQWLDVWSEYFILGSKVSSGEGNYALAGRLSRALREIDRLAIEAMMGGL